MSTARPFAYNPGTSIPGTEQVGSLSVGSPTSGFTNNPQFWNGPDEDLGYVIAAPVSGDTQPTPLSLTWDPNYAGTGIVLSSGNTVATSGQIQSSVLGTRLITSPNKVMYSIRVNQLVTGQIGFGLQDMDLNSYVGGFDAKSIGFSSDGDYLHAGTVQDSGLPTWGSVNDVVDISLDLNTGIWWIRVNGGNWNGTRNEDPSSGTGSVNSAGLNNLYPAITPFPVNIQGQVTLLSQPIYSVPAGFTFLGDITASVGFYQTSDFSDSEFIDLSQSVSSTYGTPQTFSSATDASTWLTTNGFWNSYVASLCDSFTFIGNNATTTTNSAINDGTSGWDSSAYSLETFTGPVSVTFQTSANGNRLMGGFSYNPTANLGDTYVDTSYGIYTYGGTQIEIYENGGQAAVIDLGSTVSSSDVWKVDYDGTSVKYYCNSTLLYTSTNAVTQPLHVFFPLFTPNEGAVDICAIGTLSPIPTATPTTTSTPTPSVTNTQTPTNTETPTPTPTPTPTSGATGDFTVTVSQQGPDVVWNGSGKFNLAALTSTGTNNIGGGYQASQAIWAIGPIVTIDSYSGVTTFPASFGTSGVGVTSNTGSTFGILPSGGGRSLYVPTGYTSNTTISGTSTYANQTIAGMGLTPGTYTWSWGSGGSASSLVMTITS